MYITFTCTIHTTYIHKYTDAHIYKMANDYEHTDLTDALLCPFISSVVS